MKKLRSRLISLTAAFVLLLALLPMLPAGTFEVTADDDVVTVSSFEALKNALITKENTNKTIRVTERISNVASDLQAKYPMTLDLNKHILEFGTNKDNGTGYYLSISTDGTFTITGGGTIIGKPNGGVVYLKSGKLNIDSATIKNGYGKSLNVEGSDFTKVTVANGTFVSNSKLSAGVVLAQGSIRNDYDGFTAISNNYDLSIAGEKVTYENRNNLAGGKASFDPATKTLHIKGDITGSISNGSNYGGVKDLIISIDEDCTFNFKRTNGITSYESMALTGKGKLTIKTDEYSAGNSIVMLYPSKRDNTKTLPTDLTIANADIYLSTNEKNRLENAFVASRSTDPNSALTIIDSTLYLHCTYSGSEDSGAVHGFSKINIQGCEITSPNPCTIHDGMISYNTSTVPYHMVDIYTDYGLTVSNTKVTSKNKDNILSDNKFRYDPDKKTLYINGYSGSASITNDRIKGLTINVAADSALKRANTIILNADTTITGPGKLSLTASSCGIAAYGGTTLTIKNANLDVKAKFCIVGQEADGGSDHLIIEDSDVTADTSGYNSDNSYSSIGWFANTGGITLTHEKIAYPETVVFKGGTAYEANGTTRVKKLVLEHICQHRSYKSYPAVAATCTTDGNIAYWYCTSCKKYFSDSARKIEISAANTVVKAKGHQWSEWTSSSYDMSKGKVTQKRTCSVCKASESKTVDLPSTRLAGKGRYETAVEISKTGYTTAKTVVLAYSMNYADALAGVSLAKKLKAPILLTNKNVLDTATLAEIKRLKATEVIILGGEGAISQKVVDALKANNINEKNIKRIAGRSRFGTATAIAEELNDAPTDVFFAYYDGFADALSVSPVAAIKTAPVLYLTKNGALNADTAAYLAKLKAKGCVKNAYVIGGEGVISDDMMNKAAQACGLTKATRVAGNNRYLTCVEINKKFASTLSSKTVCIATGADFPDALAGGVFAAKNASPLFLINGKVKTPSLSDKQTAYLKNKKANKITIFGGEGVVPDAHIGKVAMASV